MPAFIPWANASSVLPKQAVHAFNVDDDSNSIDSTLERAARSVIGN